MLFKFHFISNINFFSVTYFIGDIASEPNTDGTFKLTAKLWHKFEQLDDGKRLRCKVIPQPGRGKKVIKTRTIFVQCK